MSSGAPWVELSTGEGPARVQVHRPGGRPVGSLVLGHGAGGGTGAADLQSMLAATDDGWVVALVEQPWRVAGRRIATPPPRLDAAWRDLLPALVDGQDLPRPLVVGGRSAGARVACRNSLGTAGMPPADGVLCLAFPLHPPGKPDKSRAPELATPVRHGIPTLVVQGAKDPFGSPTEVWEALTAQTRGQVAEATSGDELAPAEPGDPVTAAETDGAAAGTEGAAAETEGAAAARLTVVEVPGNHSPSRDQELVVRTVRDWLSPLARREEAAASDNGRGAD